jgi:hypothetical protein
MRLHAFLFSRSCVSLAVRSHSAANFLNSSDRFIGRPSPIPVLDIPNCSQLKCAKTKQFRRSFSNAESQHSLAAVHSCSLVMERRASIRYIVEFEDAVIRKEIRAARRVSVQRADDLAQRGARA